MVYNVPVNLSGNVLASLFCTFGRVEEVTLLRGNSGTLNGVNAFLLCHKREGFSAIPDIISFRSQQVTVVVGDKRPQCWLCKQQGHLARTCSTKVEDKFHDETTTTETPGTESKQPNNPPITTRKRSGLR